jgi:hypothetical protein
MALNKLRMAIIEEFPTIDMEGDSTSSIRLLEFIDKYIEEDQAAYQKNKANKALTFGKWKGFTVKELSVSEKGASYLSWLLSQTWCDESKFGYIHEECKALNIKKKAHRRAKLE